MFVGERVTRTCSNTSKIGWIGEVLEVKPAPINELYADFKPTS
jgi:hypothetical protein